MAMAAGKKLGYKADCRPLTASDFVVPQLKLSVVFIAIVFIAIVKD